MFSTDNKGRMKTYQSQSEHIYPTYIRFPSLGWSHGIFTKIFGIRKLKSWVPGLSYSFVAVILCQTILVQYQHVTDRQTNGHDTTTAYTVQASCHMIKTRDIRIFEALVFNLEFDSNFTNSKLNSRNLS